MPGKELVDGFLILIAGVLMVTPGFVTDIFGFLLLIPPTRALVRRLLLRRFRAGPLRAGVHRRSARRCDRRFVGTFRAGVRRGDVQRRPGVDADARIARPNSGRSGPSRAARMSRCRPAGRGHGPDPARRPDGLEVFMLRRNLDSDFVGGAYVFPGGAVDPDDRHADLEAICEGRTDVEASRRLGIDAGGLAYWVAAIRESFEEAGVLLAYRPDGSIVHLDDPEHACARWAEHRRQVDDGERRLVEVCADEDLRLAVDGMHYFGHWITPEGAPRRYDTRFFLAAEPPGTDAAARRPRGHRARLDPAGRRPARSTRPASSR